MARFFRRGISELHFCPAVASASAPTVAEVGAGEDLTPDLAALNGFELNNTPIDTPNMADQFTPQIDGEDTVTTSSIDFYDQDDATDIRDALAKGTTGFLVLLPYGATTTKRAEVWPAKSTGVNDRYTVDNVAAQFNVGFAITAVPTQDGVYTA